MAVNLDHLGFDSWFAEQAQELLRSGQVLARVTAVDRGAWLVRDGRTEILAELSGKFRHQARSVVELPCVGDWVCVQVQPAGELAIIHALLPRKSYLRRKKAGKDVDYQMIAANLDLAFVMQSCHYDFNLRRLDRYMVMAREGGIEPQIVLSKTDLISPDELESLVSEIELAGNLGGVLALSNTTGQGLDQFELGLLPGQTYCLLGSSGVGKTTLLNRLVGRDEYETKLVSATGEGTHSTTRRQLVILDNGAMIIDTPGMRELGILGADEAVNQSFADMELLAQECRFVDCSHAAEPGCAVLAELESGGLRRERYNSFLKLRKESQFHQMSYVEKRHKDKAFGKMIKTFMKDKKR